MSASALKRRMFLLVLAPIAIVMWAISTPAPAGADQDAAALLVRDLHLGGKFPVLVLTAASQTQTFKMFMADAGPVKAKQVFTAHMDAVVPRYQKQWDDNLASAYAEHFTAKEMLSLVNYKEKSPYTKAFFERQRDVGLSMQRRSSDLLGKVAAEVLAGAYSEVGGKK